MRRNVLYAALALIAVPGVAHAGDFPGLVETLVAILLGIALVLGGLTEGLFSLLKHRKMRWQRGLAYSVLWLLVIYLVIVLNRA